MEQHFRFCSVIELLKQNADLTGKKAELATLNYTCYTFDRPVKFRIYPSQRGDRLHFPVFWLVFYAETRSLICWHDRRETFIESFFLLDNCLLFLWGIAGCKRVILFMGAGCEMRCGQNKLQHVSQSWLLTLVPSQIIVAWSTKYQNSVFLD